MSIQEKHMQLVDAVNNAKTILEERHASGVLEGFRQGLKACGVEPDLIGCDLVQFERGFEHRPMCCGVLLDIERLPCTCGEPHVQTHSQRIVHRYDGKPCYVEDRKL